MTGSVLWRIMNAVRRFLRQEDGIAVVEVILIIVVFIGLVLIFKSQLTTLINSIFDTISTQSSLV